MASGVNVAVIALLLPTPALFLIEILIEILSMLALDRKSSLHSLVYEPSGLVSLWHHL